MLARANRVTRAADFRAAMRGGRRVGTAHTVIHLLTRDSGEPRFGFIVGKTVGGAVDRNLVRRRMRAVSRDILSSLPRGTDVVIRALPGSADAPWATLHTEIAEGVARR